MCQCRMKGKQLLMYKLFFLMLITAFLMSETQVNAQWNERKGRGQRANSDVEKEPQPVLRKSIDDYAKEYGYGTGTRGSAGAAGAAGSANAGTSLGGTGYDLSSVPKGQLNAGHYATNLHYTCSGHWKKNSCLKSTGALSRELMNDYYKRLSDNGHEDELKILLAMCNPPAKAAEEAINETTHRVNMQKCVNTIMDLSKQTSVTPNGDMYRFASWSVICMANDRRCVGIEKRLKALGEN